MAVQLWSADTGCSTPVWSVKKKKKVVKSIKATIDEKNLIEFGNKLYKHSSGPQSVTYRV